MVGNGAAVLVARGNGCWVAVGAGVLLGGADVFVGGTGVFDGMEVKVAVGTGGEVLVAVGNTGTVGTGVCDAVGMGWDVLVAGGTGAVWLGRTTGVALGTIQVGVAGMGVDVITGAWVVCTG